MKNNSLHLLALESVITDRQIVTIQKIEGQFVALLVNGDGTVNQGAAWQSIANALSSLNADIELKESAQTYREKGENM